MNMKMKFNTLRLKDKIEVIRLKEKNCSVKDICLKFNCGKTQVYESIKKKNELQKEFENGRLTRKRKRTVENEDIDKAALEWFWNARSKNLPISGILIREKAKEIAEKLGKTKFKASNGWLISFLNRHNITKKLFTANQRIIQKTSPNEDDDYMDQDMSSKLEVKLTTPEDESKSGQEVVYETTTVKEEPVSDADEDSSSRISKPSTSGITFSVASLSNDVASDISSKSSTSQTALDAWNPPAAPSAILGLPAPGDVSESPAKSAASSPKNNQMDVTCPSDETQSLKSMSVVSDFPEPKPTTERPRDQFDVYGEYIASKLRKLDWKSCAHVQKAFSDIIFDAEMGKYKDTNQ